MKANLLNNFEEQTKRNRPITQGFTLLDLMIVIIILGILGMVIVPHISDMADEAKLNGAASELVSAFEYAKNLAITYQRPFSVRVFTKETRNQFTIKDDTSPLDSNPHPEAIPPLYSYHRVYNPVDKKPYIIDFDDIQASLEGVVAPRREYEGVSIISVPGGGGDATIVFYPDGHSSNVNSTFVLSLGNLTRTITVDGISGRVSVQ